jgi:hypothetical protein
MSSSHACQLSCLRGGGLAVVKEVESETKMEVDMLDDVDGAGRRGKI